MRFPSALLKSSTRCSSSRFYTKQVVPTAKRINLQQIRLSSFKPSYLHAVGTVPLTGTTIGNLVDIAQDIFGDNEAVVDRHQGIRKKFIDYKHDIEKLATGLLALDLKKGDRLAIWAPNRYEWTLVPFAAAKTGIILVTLNPAYQPAELEYCLRKLKVRALITQESFKTQNYYKMVSKTIPEIEKATKHGVKIKSETHPYFDTLIMMSDKNFPGAFRFEDVMNAGGSTEDQRLISLQSEIQFDDPHCVQFTSGTTGNPKGVTSSHHNLVNAAHTMAYRFGYRDDYHRLCTTLPLFHTYAYVEIILSAMANGNCIVLAAPSFSATSALRCIHEEKCSLISGTPTMYFDMLSHSDFSKTDISSIKGMIIGGAPCPPALIKRITEALKCKKLIQAYGSTELSSGIFISHRDDPLEEKMYSSGRLYDHMEAKIVDPNTGRIVPMGESGEICSRGYKVMLGYWEDEEKTREIIRDGGWYHTGDIGIFNENGTLKVIDRVKDMVIRGGENIYPTEIENFLVTHPKIANVQVFGVPDERMGEEVCAWVILRANETLNESELKEFCKNKIAHFKIPRYVIFVRDFPRTATGKLKKFVMREEMKKILAKG